MHLFNLPTVFTLFALICCETNNYAQLIGDINGDDLVDATDYYNLSEHIFEKDFAFPKSDLNGDKSFNVLDVLVMGNYLHRKGENPARVQVFSINSKAKLDIGLVDQAANEVEILVRNSVPIGGFEIKLSGTERILKVTGGSALRQGFKFEIQNSTIVGFQEKGSSIAKGEGMLLKLKITDLEIGTLCLEESVVGSPTGNRLKISIGKCADELFTKDGYRILTNYASISSKPILNYDYNEDDILDVSDVQTVQNILYREGIQPVYRKPLDSKNWIKIEYGEVDINNKTVEIIMRNQVPVAAFQFDITGIGDIEYLEGDIDATGTKIITTGNHLMGFSEEQSIIPEGRWILARLSFSNITGMDACIRRPLFVDVAGTSISGFIRRCYPLIKRVYGCTDKKALNFNPMANIDDGSCVFPPGVVGYNVSKRSWWEKLRRNIRSIKNKF